jgi:hypothetical protein
VGDLSVKLRRRAADHLYQRGRGAVHYAEDPEKVMLAPHGANAPTPAAELGGGPGSARPQTAQPAPAVKLPQGRRGLEMVGPDAYVLYHQSKESGKLLTGGRFEPGEPGQAISRGRPATASLRKSSCKHGTSAEFQAS